MLILVLFPFLVTAEWVEISQNHYKKEPFRNAINLSDLTTVKTNIYNNQSITEHQWSKGYVDRVPGLGKVQRQGIQSIERNPPVKIERNPFHHEDLITMDTPKRRVQSNMKSENSIINNVRHESRNNAPYIHRTQLAVKDGDQANDKNKLRNKQITYKKNNEGGNKKMEDESVKLKTITTTDSFELMNSDSEHLSETLQLELPVTNKENLEINTRATNVQEKNNKISNDEQKFSAPKEEHKINNTDNHGLDSLIKLLKIVSQTIQRGTRRNFGDKVRYLEDLKMSLLTTIEERIEAVFPDDTAKQRVRRSSGFSDSRGHVEFPSSESALMTISFLTFAVFLIKLVLQVIHTYKAKTMMVTPAVVATVGRAGNVFKNPSNN